MATQEQELPYKPLTFILTEIIGDPTKNKSKMEALNCVQLKYQDILIPTSVEGTNLLYLYYAFHIAPIYNWLRSLKIIGNAGGCFEKQMLVKYIASTDRSNKILGSSGTGMSACIVSPNILLDQLVPLCSKYDIVKECCSARVKILKQMAHSDCKHYIQFSIFTHCLSVEGDTGKGPAKLCVNRFYCKECENWIDTGKSQQSDNSYRIEKYPIAPVLNRYHGQKFIIGSADQSVTSYRLTQIYSSSYLVVMAANGIWYIAKYTEQAGKAGSSVSNMEICTNFHEILTKVASKKWTGLCVYVRDDLFTSCGVLKPARPIMDEFSVSDNREKKESFKANSQMLEEEPRLRQQAKSKQKQRENNIQGVAVIQQQMQPLTDPKQISTAKVLLPEMPQQLQEKYLSELQKLYPKQKEKDEYEKEYDKGKTKKIKKKVDYIKPDFNQIFKAVKAQATDLLTEKSKDHHDNPDQSSTKNHSNHPSNDRTTQVGGWRDDAGRGRRGAGRGRGRGRGRGADRGRGGHGFGGRGGHGFGGRGGHGFKGRRDRQLKKEQKSQFLKKFDAS